MNKGIVALIVLVVVVGGLFLWGVSVNNSLVTTEQAVNAAWAQVQTVYQRRADLIPNLVETVKGFAKQEREVLEAVVKARASATQTTLSPEMLNDPQAVKKFQEAQNALGGALSRLLVTVERYPELKSNANFLALQSQLEGTENRISIARRDYNSAVQAYNTRIRTFPDIIGAKVIYGAKPMVPFTATAPNAAAPPTVSF